MTLLLTFLVAGRRFAVAPCRIGNHNRGLRRKLKDSDLASQNRGCSIDSNTTNARPLPNGWRAVNNVILLILMLMLLLMLILIQMLTIRIEGGMRNERVTRADVKRKEDDGDDEVGMVLLGVLVLY